MTDWKTPADLAVETENACKPVGSGVSAIALRMLLEEVYALSLLKNEGRPIVTTVCLLQQDNLPESAPIVLPKPEEFSASTLRRLAPSVPGAPFAIMCRDTGHGAEIKGWFRIERRRIGLLEDQEWEGVRFEGGVWARILGPGDLEVWSSHMLHTLGPVGSVRLMRSQLHLVRGNLFTALVELGLIASAATRLWPRIVPVAQGLGHGGTFLVLPQTKAEAIDASWRSSIGRMTEVEGRALHELVAEYQSATSDEQHAKLERVLDAAQCLAYLSATDGCVIVDRTMRVLAFAAEILPGGADEDVVVTNHGPIATGTFDLRSVGTRHRSSVRFCSNHPGAVAIVLSQDGDVTLFVGRSRAAVDRHGPFRFVPPAQVYGGTD